MKYRHHVFGDRRLKRMEGIMRAVCADFECELVELHIQANHGSTTCTWSTSRPKSPSPGWSTR
jgi:REP element-mobilizing transposase RayT